jgi:predicted permease
MLGKDLLHAARGLSKSPAFALTAVTTIALGIGASTAIFSVVNAVLLQPLPYRDATRLAFIESDMRHRNVVDFPISGPDFIDMRRGNTQFEEIAAIVTGRTAVRDDFGEPDLIRDGTVTFNFLRVLGARVVLGRDFNEADCVPPPAPPPPAPGAAPAPPPGPPLPVMAILSDELWKRRYGGNPGVIGRSIDFGGGKAQIVGVLEPGFELLFPPRAGVERLPEIWTAGRFDLTQGRNDVFLHLIGRLKPGATLATAQSEADRFGAEMRRLYSIKNTAGFYFRVEPMQQHLVAEVRPAILALMGAVTFLLLIACANVANLLLVRAATRGRELAVRAALGGNRWALIRQMLAEVFLLAASGAVLGLGLAGLGINLLIYLGPKNLPRLHSVTIDLPVLAFTVLATMLAATVFGVLPAWRASRPDIMDVLRASGRTTGLGSGRLLRNAVVMTEVALSFVLLIGCGLMVRSFYAITHVDPGFRPANLLTFLMFSSPGLRTPELRAAFMNDFRSRLRALPGAVAVSSSDGLPLDGSAPLARWGTDAALTDPAKFHQANFFAVAPGYFETMGTRLLAGRTFTDADNSRMPRIIIIDDVLAAKAFPHENAVGKRLLCRIITPEPEFFEVVGVVEHQRHESLAAVGHDGAFVTDGYFGFGAAVRYAIRTQGDPMQLAPLVRAEIARFDKRLAVSEMQPEAFYVNRAQAQTRFALVLIALFAVIAAVLAAVGLYGVLASAVRQRTAEIGVRIALGAAPAKIFGLVVGQGLRLSVVGIAVGLAASILLTRVMASMLVGVKPTDPATFAAMAAVFLAVASFASWLPARRAAGLDPSSALREE